MRQIDVAEFLPTSPPSSPKRLLVAVVLCCTVAADDTHSAPSPNTAVLLSLHHHTHSGCATRRAAPRACLGVELHAERNARTRQLTHTPSLPRPFGPGYTRPPKSRRNAYGASAAYNPTYTLYT